MMKRIEDKLFSLGERRIIRELILPFVAMKEIDDASFYKFNGLTIVMNIDTFVDKTDAPRGMPFDSYGYKTVIMASSDLVAKGAKPEIFLLSASVPREMLVTDFSQILSGVARACEKYNINFLGGDLNEATDVVLSGVSIGTAKRVIKRIGLEPGDYLWVTGSFGLTGAALHYLIRNGRPIPEAYMKKILDAFFYPSLRIECLQVLTLYAKSSIDSSDGLASSLIMLSELNGVKIIVEKLPVDPLAAQYAEKNHINVSELVFFGGEEFEIIFGTSHKLNEGLVKNCNIKYLGRVERGGGVYFKGRRITGEGYEHFRS